MTNVTEDDLLEALAAELSLPPIQPGDVTAKMLAERAGVSMSTATRLLERKVAAGELVEAEAATADGHRCKVYRRKAK